MSFSSQSFGSQPLVARSASQLEHEMRVREEYEKEQKEIKKITRDEAGKQNRLLKEEMHKSANERKFSEKDFAVVDRLARTATTAMATSPGANHSGALSFAAKHLALLAQEDDHEGLELLGEVIATILKKAPPNTKSTLEFTGKYFKLLALADAETARDDEYSVSSYDVFTKRA